MATEPVHSARILTARHLTVTENAPVSKADDRGPQQRPISPNGQWEWDGRTWLPRKGGMAGSQPLPLLPPGTPSPFSAAPTPAPPIPPWTPAPVMPPKIRWSKRLAETVRVRWSKPLAGAIALLSIGLVAGYLIGRPPQSVSARFVSVSSTAACIPVVPGQFIYKDCKAVGVFRNQGGVGSALVEFRATGTGVVGTVSGSCTTAIPRTGAGDVVEVSCPLTISTRRGIYQGLPYISTMITNP